MWKITKTYSFNDILITFVLFAVLSCGLGCDTPKPKVDPLANFHFSSLNNLHSNKAISNDCQEYIAKISLKKESFIAAVDFFENESGQHAVDIKEGINGR